ncbi:MAG: hypothetical protein IPP32_08925 [Bacteroidetes bacterium]|nr:hypothetical protein [Bacteroidota bacterium]
MMKLFFSFLLQLCLPILAFSQEIDVLHLALNLKFDWQKRQAYGTAEITARVLNTSNILLLDAAKLHIESVYIKNKKLKFVYNDSAAKNALALLLDKNCLSGDTVKITINYHTTYENKSDPNAIWGSFGKGLRFFEPTSTTPNKHKQIWSSGEPEGNKYWFPCKEDIADLHTTEITATVELPLMVISNGKLIETIVNADNTRTFHYASNVSFPNYLVSLVVGEYVDVVQKTERASIHNFAYSNEIEAVKATTKLLPDMLAFLEEKTGFTYPFNQYSQVMLQDYPFPGLNGQHMLGMLSDNYIDDYGVHQDFSYLWDGIAVQALAGQWFGNLISPQSWEDNWLNAAFAQYFAGCYTAKNNTKDEYLSYYIPFEKGTVLADWQSGYKHPIRINLQKDTIGFVNDNYAKYRGALVLRMLQKEVGETNWWNIIHTYVKKYAHKQVTTDNFIEVVNAVTGKSYQWFFEQWVDAIGLPEFKVTQVYNLPKKELELHVSQTQNLDSTNKQQQVGYFKGMVEIEMDNNIKQIQLEAKQENVFTFHLTESPKMLNFDWEETWICETKFEKTKEEYLYQLANSKSVLARQKAMDALVGSAMDTTIDLTYKAKVEAAFKNEIQSNAYWRYRMYALGALRKISSKTPSAATEALLLNLIKNESSWLKTSAISFLGNSADANYVDIYINALTDKSDRVVNAAAIALGKTKSPLAFETLIALDKKPSWKSQSRISALNGLQQLGDPRALEFSLNCLKDNKSPRWYLATPVWDYPFAAVNTICALEKAEAAYPILFDRFTKSLIENDLNDIFQNVQLLTMLADSRGKEVYAALRIKFAEDALLMEAIQNYENQYLENLKK